MVSDGAEIGRRVARFRLERGYGKAELAKKARVSKGYITRLEKGDYKRPSGAMLGKLAGALGVSVDALLTGTVPTTAEMLEELRRAAAVHGLALPENLMVDEIDYLRRALRVIDLERAEKGHAREDKES